jgi:hypothetical protein
MDFFAGIKLRVDGKKKNTNLTATGPLILEAKEGGEVIFSRELDIRYTAVQERKGWRQRLEVRAGQEDIFTFEDVTLDLESPACCNLEGMEHLKFVIFTELISNCLEKHAGNLKTRLDFEDPPPELISVLLELCGGRAN